MRELSSRARPMLLAFGALGLLCALLVWRRAGDQPGGTTPVPPARARPGCSSRHLASLAATVLIAVGTLGLVTAVGITLLSAEPIHPMVSKGPAGPEERQAWPAVDRRGVSSDVSGSQEVAEPRPGRGSVDSAPHSRDQPDARRGEGLRDSVSSGSLSRGDIPAMREATSQPISRVRIPVISLDTPVVTAPWVETNGGTWQVPPFVAGHAEHTPGAGQRGNVLLLGHVESRNLGNVFRDLSAVGSGDDVQVAAGDRLFHYRVVETRVVSRTDVSVLASGDSFSLTLITCTGTWLPTIRDYAERLVVRAELTSMEQDIRTEPV